MIDSRQGWAERRAVRLHGSAPQHRRRQIRTGVTRRPVQLIRTGGGDMAHRLRLVGPLCVVVAVVLVTTMDAGASQKVDCSTQVNDTAAKLLPCITETDLMTHMQAFENI